MSDKNSQEDVSEANSVSSEKDDLNDESMYVEGEKALPDKEDKKESVGVKKYQSTYIVNIDDLYSDDEYIGKKLAPGIDKRLKKRKGKVVVSASKPSKASKKSVGVGPAKGWRKVVTTKKRLVKRNEVSSSESEYDVEQNVLDIMPLAKKGVAGKNIPANVPEVPINNISFHYVENFEKWKYVYQRRLALERNLGKDALEFKEVVDLIEDVGLMKSIVGFGNCYEMLVKEIIVNVSKYYESKMSKEYMKVYVRGKCVEFSPKVINRFMGRSDEEKAEVEVTDNVVYREITRK